MKHTKRLLACALDHLYPAVFFCGLCPFRQNRQLRRTSGQPERQWSWLLPLPLRRQSAPSAYRWCLPLQPVCFLQQTPNRKAPDNNSQTSDNSGKTCHSHGKRSVHQSGCQWFRHHRPCSLVQEQLLCACESACRQTFRSGWPCQ